MIRKLSAFYISLIVLFVTACSVQDATQLDKQDATQLGKYDYALDQVSEVEARETIDSLLSSLLYIDNQLVVETDKLPKSIDAEAFITIVDAINALASKYGLPLASPVDLETLLDRANVPTFNIDEHQLDPELEAAQVGACTGVTIHNPHYSRYENNTTKVKASGSCNFVGRAPSRTTLNLKLQQQKRFLFFRYYSTVRNGLFTRYGPTPRWNDRTTTVRMPCVAGTYRGLGSFTFSDGWSSTSRRSAAVSVTCS